MWIHTYTHTYIQSHTYILDTYITYIHTYIHTYMHTYINMYIYIHICPPKALRAPLRGGRVNSQVRDFLVRLCHHSFIPDIYIAPFKKPTQRRSWVKASGGGKNQLGHHQELRKQLANSGGRCWKDT